MRTDQSTRFLNRLLKLDVDLPNKIFVLDYEEYLFFEGPLSTYEPFVSLFERVIKSCFDDQGEVHVYASMNRNYLGKIDGAANWVVNLKNIHNADSASIDHGELVIVDCKKRWIAYQHIPTDLGVLAINSEGKISQIRDLEDGFGDCAYISDRLRSKLLRDTSFIRIYGESYIETLLKNYC